MAAPEWSLSEAYEVIAAAAPERDALVYEGARRSYAEVAARARSLAGFLGRRGVDPNARRPLYGSPRGRPAPGGGRPPGTVAGAAVSSAFRSSTGGAGSAPASPSGRLGG